MTISTSLDANRRPALIGTLDSDGVTPVVIKVNPANNSLMVSNGTTGSSFTATDVERDANRNTAIWGVSSADGKTPVYIATDVNGNLLVKST